MVYNEYKDKMKGGENMSITRVNENLWKVIGPCPDHNRTYYNRYSAIDFCLDLSQNRREHHPSYYMMLLMGMKVNDKIEI